MINQSNKVVSIQLQNNDIHIQGALTHDTVMSALEQTLQLFSPSKAFTVNLREVTQCDSSSLAFLTALLKESKKMNFQITFVQVPQGILELAKVSGISNLLPIEHSEKE